MQIDVVWKPGDSDTHEATLIAGLLVGGGPELLAELVTRFAPSDFGNPANRVWDALLRALDMKRSRPVPGLSPFADLDPIDDTVYALGSDFEAIAWLLWWAHRYIPKDGEPETLRRRADELLGQRKLGHGGENLEIGPPSPSDRPGVHGIVHERRAIEPKAE